MGTGLRQVARRVQRQGERPIRHVQRAARHHGGAVHDRAGRGHSRAGRGARAGSRENGGAGGGDSVPGQGPQHRGTVGGGYRRGYRVQQGRHRVGGRRRVGRVRRFGSNERAPRQVAFARGGRGGCGDGGAALALRAVQARDGRVCPPSAAEHQRVAVADPPDAEQAGWVPGVG